MAEKKAVPKTAPAAAPKPSIGAKFVFKGTGVTEGASGKKWAHVKNVPVDAPAGEFDHLFDANGKSRYCSKK